MGASCHSKPNPGRKDSTRHTLYKNDEVLKFYVKLSNIKGRNIPSTSSYVRVNFAGEKPCNTAETYGCMTNYLWNFKKEFEFEITRKRLLTATIKLTLIDKDQKEIATASEGLINTVVSPIHHDLVLMRQRVTMPHHFAIDTWFTLEKNGIKINV